MGKKLIVGLTLILICMAIVLLFSGTPQPPSTLVAPIVVIPSTHPTVSNFDHGPKSAYPTLIPTFPEKARVLIHPDVAKPKATATLSGTAFFKGKGTPVTGALVDAMSPDARATIWTGGDGKFHMEGLPPGQYVVIGRRGDLPSAGLVVEVSGNTFIELLFDIGNTIEGHVTLEPGGNPLPDVTIVGLNRSTKTDSNGAYKLEGLPGKPFQLGATKGGLHPPTIVKDIAFKENEAGSTKQVDFSFQSGAGIVGRVLESDSKEPIKGAGITASSSLSSTLFQVQSGSDGAFTLNGLPAGRLRINAEAQGYAPSDVQSIQLKPGRSMDIGILLLARGGSITGRVEGMTHVRVESVGPRSRRVTTDMTGNFHLDQLPPGSYRVVARVPGFGVAESKPIQLRHGENKKGLVLKIGKGVSLAGVVVDAARRPLEGVRVTVGVKGKQDVAMTNQKGAFEVAGLLAKTYIINAGKEGYAVPPSQKVHVSTTQSPHPVTFQLFKSESLSGTVVDPFGAPVTGAVILAKQNSRTLEPGWTNEFGMFSLEGAGPGPVTLLVGAAGFETQTLNRPSPGSPHRVTLKPPTKTDSSGPSNPSKESIRFVGTVMERDGTPIPGALVLCGLKDSEIPLSGSTNGSGRFSIPLKSAGSYEIGVLSPLHMKTMTLDIGPNGANVEIRFN